MYDSASRAELRVIRNGRFGEESSAVVNIADNDEIWLFDASRSPTTNSLLSCVTVQPFVPVVNSGPTHIVDLSHIPF